MAWEIEHDCISRFRTFIIDNSLATTDELDAMETEVKRFVNEQRKLAWDAYLTPIKQEIGQCSSLLQELADTSGIQEIQAISQELLQISEPIRKDIGTSINKALRLSYGHQSDAKNKLKAYKQQFRSDNAERYNSYLFSESNQSALKVPFIAPAFSEQSKMGDGREVMQAFFDIAIQRDPRVFAFGEDVGKIGDVNQGFAGLQEKHGESRVFDTGIRELTIIGQGIGASMRGLRPIAEIQYLDYLLYGLQPLSDDLATLQYRTKGGQKAPLIIRTRGHRLEGIWHSGSPIGMILHALRGIHVLVPRNMVQAAGFYNTMLQSDEPALIIECLNGYRIKERLPDNIGDYTTPLGVPETLISGDDVTVISYGSTLRVAEEAIKQLQEIGISCELIDVQSLLPFDIHHQLVESLKRTNKLVIVDEDVPGGASAYILQQILEVQNGYQYLDAKPLTITAKPHRPPYGTDGDYFSKPNAEDIFEAILELMHDYHPNQFSNYNSLVDSFIAIII